MKQRLTTIAGAALLSAMLLAACGGSQAPAPTASAQKPSAAQGTGDAAKGKTKFATICVACHGPDAKGVAGLGKDLHNNAFIAGLSDADAVKFLKTGRPASDPLNTTKVDMPPKGGNPALSDADLLDIVVYIRSLK